MNSTHTNHHEPTELVRVHVREDLNATLAGHDGLVYVTPPQPRDAALELVALLLGRPIRAGEDHWVRPIAGGRRTITLTPTADGTAATAAS